MYVYKHINGEYIFKPDVIVRTMGAIEYFKSDFVKAYWHFVTDDEAEKFVEDRKNEETETSTK